MLLAAQNSLLINLILSGEQKGKCGARYMELQSGHIAFWAKGVLINSLVFESSAEHLQYDGEEHEEDVGVKGSQMNCAMKCGMVILIPSFPILPSMSL